MFVVIYPSDVQRKELKAGASIYETADEAEKDLIKSIADACMHPTPGDDIMEYFHATVYELKEA